MAISRTHNSNARNLGIGFSLIRAAVPLQMRMQSSEAAASVLKSPPMCASSRGDSGSCGGALRGSLCFCAKNPHLLIEWLGAACAIFFADHTLDTDTRELRRGSEQISVQPLVFDLLIYLIENRDRVVTRENLLAGLWGGRTIADSTLATHSTRRGAPSAMGRGAEADPHRGAQGAALRRRGANCVRRRRAARSPRLRRGPPHCLIPAAPRSRCSPSTI